MTAALTVAGITPFTTIDYPGGMLSAVLFLQGCPWHCQYCHNTHLLPRKTDQSIPWDDVLFFLKKRQGILDAVVLSGGEPTVQTELPEAIQEIKKLNYKIGLHTAGIYPQRLEKIIHLIDWVGMDIKAPFCSYENVTHVASSGTRALKSAESILKSGVAYEFRTTLDPWNLDEKELFNIAHALEALGVENFALQEFRQVGQSQFASLEKKPLSFDHACAIMKPFFKNFIARSVGSDTCS